MDYSIILMNRFRQEKENFSDKYDAMKTALSQSISSIASSSLTTVVGLLALVFLSFKLGPELGIVLAKGVFISMLCTFTVLPVMILAMDSMLEKTRKKSLSIPMGFITKISYAARYAMPVIFVVLLVGSYFLQGYTTILFTEKSEDPLIDIFPKENTTVVIYKNSDEQNTDGIISELEKDPNITSILGFSNTLGKKMTSSEMNTALMAMGGDVRINEDIVKMLYFVISGEPTPEMTAEEFLNFISESVVTNTTLKDYIDDSIRENAAYLEKFSHAEALTAPLTAEEMADFFGIEKERLSQLYLLYTVTNGVEYSGTMSLCTFADFVLNTVAADPTYGSMFDESSLSSLRQMQTYTDKSKVQANLTPKELSSLLGMDVSTVKTVFILKNAGDVSKKSMTVAEFADFLCTELVNDPPFGTYFDADTKAQLQTMHSLTSYAESGEKLDASTMAQLLGTDEKSITSLYRLYFTSHPSFKNDGKIALDDFTEYIVNSILTSRLLSDRFTDEQAAQMKQLDSIVQLSAAGSTLNTSGMANIFGMDAGMITTVYKLYFGADISGMTMSLESMTDFILSDSTMSGMMDYSDLAQLKTLQTIIKATVNGTLFTSAQIASLFGMDSSQAEQLYILKMYYDGGADTWRLSPRDFVAFAVTDVLTNEAYSAEIDEKTASDMLLGHTIIEAVVSGKSYGVDEMTALLASLSDSVTKQQVEALFLFYGGLQTPSADTVMTIPELFTYISEGLLTDERFSGFFDDSTKEQIVNSKTDLTNAILQMQGEKYSRLVITADYPDESDETSAFINGIDKLCGDKLSEYYLIGNSVMVNEMQGTFRQEYLMITLITAIAIFFVVLLTFRNPVLPLILTLIVQCGVFITVTVIGVYSSAIYYLALLIVQSILMGATIDYGIVFCNFYREYRVGLPVGEALKAAYEGSIHTIMTSGSILVIVLAALGIFAESVTISEVCITLSIGVFVAILLILFVLPGMVACCDKLIYKNKRS